MGYCPLKPNVGVASDVILSILCALFNCGLVYKCVATHMLILNPFHADLYQHHCNSMIEEIFTQQDLVNVTGNANELPCHY